LFSEESGWTNIGTGVDYVIVVDPFDQSSLTTKTFRGAAVAICVMDQAYRFKACAIGDLSTHLIYFADHTGAYVLFTIQDTDLKNNTLEHARIAPSSVQSLSEALLICPGMKRKRRQFLLQSSISNRAFELLNIDGVINLGRLAAGYIDAYLDPFVGQPIYEIVCAELAQRAGATVTDIAGVPFDLAALIRQLEIDSEARYKIVACCSQALHQEVLEMLANDRKAGLLSYS
jgi:fructose-1,6-bisphosphatase/inositol monophosphatase family enzyme